MVFSSDDNIVIFGNTHIFVIGDLKKCIEEYENVRPEDQRLIFQGKRLEDGTVYKNRCFLCVIDCIDSHSLSSLKDDY
jgi:hypothetical protein